MNHPSCKTLRFLLLLFGVWLSQTTMAQPRTIKIAGGSAPAGTERRLALVVGNQDYLRQDARLRNPVNDANAVGKALDALGFDVILATNLSMSAFRKAVDDFGSRLAGYDVALFYYSGHGLQFNGENYLVPVDATLQTLSDAEDDCLRLGRIMGKMKAARVRNNIVFLDACRSNPFPKNMGDKAAPQKGLVIPNNPPGTLVVFATEEGSTADDNARESNGLFTSELLKYLTVPDLSLSDIVLNTRQGVYARSGERQLPADYNKMLGAFYFVKRDKPVPSAPDNTRPTPASPTDLPVGPEMVRVKGGTFRMGSKDGEADEKPVHTVTVNDFLIGKYEVTVSEYMQFVEATGSHYPEWLEAGNKYHIQTGTESYYKDKGYTSVRSRLPIVGVNRHDAEAYCEWLSRRSGKPYRLPTEAEWEYAARGGQSSRSYQFSGSNSVDEAGWYGDNSGGQPHEVGQKAANELGLYDMSGNVWEWCQDWYGSYDRDNQINPTGPATGAYRVLRGGSWFNEPQICRSANRYNNTPALRDNIIGYRVVSPVQ
ncbi:hypothetical protein GCM10023187_51950 [Nibrella viscosa]|uniref:Caspase family p20 domain-containing protein n=1 Tax=Nibrella viscosa TaxID=1084524 RepID=A0ABP8KZ52_9BACT